MNPSSSDPSVPDPCCSDSCGCGDLNRRDFLRTVSLGVAAHILASETGAMAGPFTRPANDFAALIPPDKKLSPDWVRGLTARGRPSSFSGKELDTIGMPVGGIGAGQLYLRGDGTLGCWQIFNHLHFTGYGETNYQYRTPDAPVDHGLAVLVRRGQRVTVHRLDRTGFRDIRFTGHYPVGYVTYRDPDAPIRVYLEAFSPFIPLNAEDSGLPATVLQVNIQNITSEPINVSLVTWLENAVCFHSAPEVVANRRTRIVREPERAYVVHSIEPAPGGAPADRETIVLADFENGYGDWKTAGESFGSGPVTGKLEGQGDVTGFEGKAFASSFHGGDKSRGTLTSPEFVINRRYINLLVGGARRTNVVCVNLLIDGQVVRTATGHEAENLIWHTWWVGEFEGRRAVIQVLDDFSDDWGHLSVDHIELSDTRREKPLGKLETLEDYGTMALALAGPTLANTTLAEVLRNVSGALPELGTQDEAAYPSIERRRAALASEWKTLQRGVDSLFTSTVSWHFPNLRSYHKIGDFMTGRYYASRFPNAQAVSKYVLDNLRRLAGDTLLWHHTFYDSTLPYWLLELIGATLSCLASGTCEWWSNGRFWGWEGVGCCYGTCTHVWNYAQGMARLFPQLEKSIREMQDLDAALHTDGLVGFRGLRDGHYAPDGQAGTVLKCYREHLMSADDAFLKRNWPNIRRVIEFLLHQDGDANGILENSQHNTYDINFEGPNTFVGSLYLAALLAGAEMAERVGQADFARQLREIFAKGKRFSEEQLWNGEYFIQKVDLAQHPRFQYANGCLSDQVFGQNWAHQVALGYVYEPRMVRTALQSVWKYCWALDIAPYNALYHPERWFIAPGEAGLLICTWPRGGRPEEPVRYRDEVWNGVEFQVGTHMLYEGMMTEGLAVMRAVYDRYHPLRHNPFNMIECGDHYARAMASWAAILALSGFEYDGPRGYMAFAPTYNPRNFRSVFTAAEGWGTFAQHRTRTEQENRLDVRWGKLTLRTLALGVPGGGFDTAVVTRNGDPVPASVQRDGKTLRITFNEPLTLDRDDALVVRTASGPVGATLPAR